MKKVTTLFTALVLCLLLGNAAMGQSMPTTWKEFDLTKYKMPFSIMAPASATFDYDGDSEELYINADDANYRLMIAVYDDEKPADLIAEYKEEVEENEDAPFSGYTIDEPNGFVAEEDYDGVAEFELFYAFSLKGKTYFIQANPLEERSYAEADITNMFHACKKAAGI